MTISVHSTITYTHIFNMTIFVNVNKDYLFEACLNLVAALLGVPLNVWLVVRGVKALKGKFKSRFSVSWFVEVGWILEVY